MSLPADSEKPLKVIIEDDYPEIPNVSASPVTNESAKSDSGIQHKYHLDEFIPPKHDHRTVVLCFDGTGDQFDQDVRTTFID